MKDDSSRRDFLKNSFVGGLGLYLGSGGLHYSHANQDDGNTLITIFLRGGMDALSAVGPLQEIDLWEAWSKKVRPKTIYGMEKLSNDDFFGINEQFNDNFKNLFKEGSLAILHGVGGLNESTSHFVQSDFVESGRVDRISRDGFLHRFAVARGESDKNYAIEERIPHSLLGTSQYVMHLQSEADLAGIGNRNRNYTSGIKREEFLRYFFKRTFRKAKKLMKSHHDYLKEVSEGLEKQSGDFKNKQMRLVSKMVCSGFSGSYTLSVGGWDDHKDVKAGFVKRHNALFKDVSELVADLKARGKFNKTTIVILTEFGRRIKENGALGSDHGRGGVSYVIGGKIKGGKIYRTNGYENDLKSSIAKIGTNEKNNSQFVLKVETDIRLVFAKIFKKQFGLNEEKIREIFPSGKNDLGKLAFNQISWKKLDFWKS